MTGDPTPADWAALAAKEVKDRELTWETPEGIPVKPLYTAEDVAGIDAGLPGFAPFTRPSRHTTRPQRATRCSRSSSSSSAA